MYLDVQSPDWLRRMLAQRAPEWGMEVVRFDEPLWPHEARNRVVGGIDTDYVIFIDNDIIADQGWLDALVACADETGAGVVGPLYLWGDGVRPPKIHMAGGKLLEEKTPAGRHLVETHALFDSDPKEMGPRLRRQPCDFVEYHCTLLRTALVRDGTLLDPQIRCVHEHIDTALSVKRLGYPVIFEPASRVTYLAYSDYMLDELPFFKWRWSEAEADANIQAFCRKWDVINDDRSFGSVRQFVRAHVAQINPIRRLPESPADHRVVMRREELGQNRSDLLDLAQARGYRPKDLALIADAHHVAHVLMAGGYRPCGRPFINHLVGTACVLVRYDFRPDVVAAGLLHAAYTHSRPHPEGRQAGVDEIGNLLGGVGSPVERRVRAYTEREATWAEFLAQDAESLSTLSVPEAEIIAIAAANEIDMHLSGEFRYSGRKDEIKPAAMERIGSVCELLGVSGLAATLAQARSTSAAVPPALMTSRQSSYRVMRGKQSPVSMRSGAADRGK
jgi:hypothetical protein